MRLLTWSSCPRLPRVICLSIRGSLGLLWNVMIVQVTLRRRKIGQVITAWPQDNSRVPWWSIRSSAYCRTSHETRPESNASVRAESRVRNQVTYMGQEPSIGQDQDRHVIAHWSSLPFSQGQPGQLSDLGSELRQKNTLWEQVPWLVWARESGEETGGPQHPHPLPIWCRTVWFWEFGRKSKQNTFH